MAFTSEWFLNLSAAHEESRKKLQEHRDTDTVIPPSLVFSHRQMSVELLTARSSQSGGTSSPQPAAAASSPSPPPSVAAAPPPVETLMQQYGEVECLLRVPLVDAAALQKARDRVASALAFDARLTELAAESGALKGTIFQDLLAALREAGASHAQVDLSFRERSGSVAELLGLNLSEWASLQGQADALRNLVRIKVADDNDLKAANLALQTCSDFFGGLTLAAAAQGIGDFDLLKTL